MKQGPDEIIRELLDPRREPTGAEIQKTLDYVAKAPFSTRPGPVDRTVRSQVFQGKELGRSEPSIVAHLAKRVLAEKQ